MSAEKPEVGDVWERHGYKYHIVDIRHWELTYIYYIDKDLNEDYEPIDIFINNWKYLCKSKASIEDLFEME